ncbi:hypothetical protein ACTHGU_10910 [Chitinophagaceae bacterium MMS25-I14]
MRKYLLVSIALVVILGSCTKPSDMPQPNKSVNPAKTLRMHDQTPVDRVTPPPPPPHPPTGVQELQSPPHYSSDGKPGHN